MVVLKSRENPLPDFHLVDEYGNKISFKYHYDSKKPAIGIFEIEYKHVLLKINYLNNPRQRQCSLNSARNLLFEKRFHTKAAFFCSPLDLETNTINGIQSAYNAASSPFNFKLLKSEDLIKIDKKLLEVILEKYIDQNDEFETGKFMAYYELFSKNVYEVIDDLFRTKILDFLSLSGYSSLSEKLFEANQDVYQLLEIITELEKTNQSQSLLKKINHITGYALHFINNVHILSSPTCHEINEFHVSSQYLTEFDFCIPLPSDEILKSEYSFQDELRFDFPLNEIATQYYFPYYLWEKYFDQIKKLKMPLEILESIDDFNFKLKEHLLSTSEIGQFID